MTFIPAPQSKISTLNSTETVLTASGIWLGAAEDVSRYASVATTIVTEPATTKGVLQLQFSANGTDWDILLPHPVTGSADGSSYAVHYSPVVNKWFRAKYTEEGANQTEIMLQTLLSVAPAGNAQFPGETHHPSDINETVRSIITGKNESSSVYQEVCVNNEGELHVAVPRAAFGELLTVAPQPRAQIDCVYGINTSDVITLVSGSGAVSALDTDTGTLMMVETGPAINSQAQAFTHNALRYRAGVGGQARFTARFATPAAGSEQFSGLFKAGNACGFGYNGTSFGTLHRMGGQREIQTLTITTAPTGAHSTTVTLNGSGTIVSIPAAGSVAYAAWALASGSYPGWVVSQLSATVQFVSQFAQPYTGQFLLNNTGISGSFVQTRSGTNATSTWTPQASWNIDACDGSGSSGFTLNPQNGNVYDIEYQYLGFGGITYYVENPITSRFMQVHRMRYANANTTPNFSNPTFNIGAYAKNTTNATNIKLGGASYALFSDGIQANLSLPRSFIATKTSVGATNFTALLSIRNRLVVRGYPNEGEIKLQNVSFGAVLAAGSAVIECIVVVNAPIGGNTNWAPIDTNTSIAAQDTNGTVLSGPDPGGTRVHTIAITSGNQRESDLSDLNIILRPGDYVTLAVRGASTPTCVGSVTWTED